jgi:hypothetical protein
MIIDYLDDKSLNLYKGYDSCAEQQSGRRNGMTNGTLEAPKARSVSLDRKDGECECQGRS